MIGTNDKPDFMLSEMLEQPRIINSYLSDPNVKDVGSFLQKGSIKRIYLTGSGDSYCAAWFGAYLGETWHPDLNTRHYAPFEFVNYVKTEKVKNSAVIGISVSGNTPRVVEAIRFAQKHGAQTIGITDNPQGKIAKESDHTLYINASPPESLETSSYTSKGAKEYTGYHHDVAQTKTYLANLAIQSLLMSYLLQQRKNTLNQIQETFQLVTQSLKQRDHFLEIGSALGGSIDKVIFVVSGPNSPTGLFGAYKMFEFALNGFTCDIEEYCHTAYFITTEHSLVIFIASDSCSFNRIMEIEPVIREKINAKTVVLTSSDFQIHTSPYFLKIQTPKETALSPLIYTIPVEFISYSIAKCKGFDTNRFRGGQDTEKYVSGSFRTIRQSKLHY